MNSRRSKISERFGLQVTVSLTTVSYRIGTVHKVIESLLAQTYRPEGILLWLSREPHLLDEGVESIPSQLAVLAEKEEFFEIRWTENTGPYRKLLPARMESEHLVVTCDDDTLYPPRWLEMLIMAHLANPGCIMCCRGRLMQRDTNGGFLPYRQWPRFDDPHPSLHCFATGKDGVLYPPESLSEEASNKSAFLRLCPTADDIWFKAMSLLAGVPTMRVLAHTRDYPVVADTNRTGLFTQVNRVDNDQILAETFAHYGLLQVCAEPPD